MDCTQTGRWFWNRIWFVSSPVFWCGDFSACLTGRRSTSSPVQLHVVNARQQQQQLFLSLLLTRVANKWLSFCPMGLLLEYMLTLQFSHQQHIHSVCCCESLQCWGVMWWYPANSEQWWFEKLIMTKVFPRTGPKVQIFIYESSRRWWCFVVLRWRV